MESAIDLVNNFMGLLSRNGGVSTIDRHSVNTKAVRNVVMDGRKMKVLPAAVWQSLDWESVRLFLHYNGTYVVPTMELIDYLRELIAGERTIEIAAGNGWVGRALHIPLTDSCLQRDNHQVVSMYKEMGQPVIHYPKDIITCEASDAVRRFLPHTVIGCFATHKWRDDLQHGNYWGIDFEDVYRHVNRLILVGNDAIHCYNPLMEIPHKTVNLPGLITRCNNGLNRIYIWEHSMF